MISSKQQIKLQICRFSMKRTLMAKYTDYRASYCSPQTPLQELGFRSQTSEYSRQDMRLGFRPWQKTRGRTPYPHQSVKQYTNSMEEMAQHLCSYTQLTAHKINVRKHAYHDMMIDDLIFMSVCLFPSEPGWILNGQIWPKTSKGSTSTINIYFFLASVGFIFCSNLWQEV